MSEITNLSDQYIETERDLQSMVQSAHLEEKVGILKALLLINPEKKIYAFRFLQELSEPETFDEAKNFLRFSKPVLGKKQHYRFSKILELVAEKRRLVFREKKFDSKAKLFAENTIINRKIQNAKEHLISPLRYNEYPRVVHIETMATCNAACNFCPYETMDRKGTKMPIETIERVIDELSVSPYPLAIFPYKVSEPFLDNRWFKICKYIENKAPKASVSFITNGHALTDRNIELLWSLGNVKQLTISVNEADPDKYFELMRVSQKPLVRALDRLAKKSADQPPPFKIRLSRVADGTDGDVEYREWCKQRYGGVFNTYLVALNDWIGQVDEVDRETPDLPCNRWFDLSITATGKVAMCCMDGQCLWPIGDVNESNVLDIYNSEHYRQFRRTLYSRKQTAGPCSTCSYI